MSPLTDKLDKHGDDLQHPNPRETLGPTDANLPSSKDNFMYDTTHSAKDTGIVLDANREVRIKLYMGWVCYYFYFFLFSLKEI
jgi:hypothetical protein